MNKKPTQKSERRSGPDPRPPAGPAAQGHGGLALHHRAAVGRAGQERRGGGPRAGRERVVLLLGPARCRRPRTPTKGPLHGGHRGDDHAHAEAARRPHPDPGPGTGARRASTTSARPSRSSSPRSGVSTRARPPPGSRSRRCMRSVKESLERVAALGKAISPEVHGRSRPTWRSRAGSPTSWRQYRAPRRGGAGHPRRCSTRSSACAG